MSLLDSVVNDTSLESLNECAIWNEYEKLDAELHQSMLEIDRICTEFRDGENFYGCREKTLMAVGAAWLWWILAVNLMQINISYQNQNRLLICDNDK